MCGRTRCTLTHEEVVEIAGVAPEDFVNGDRYIPVENMGPGRYGPILVQNCGAKNRGDKKVMTTHLQAMQWGLVPSFTKAKAKPDHFLMFNARSESLQDRPAFKRLLESKRCIVLCEGYYEWQQVDKRKKQPYYFYRKDLPMKFAGLYDQWQNEAGEVMCTYTIVTTAVSPELTWVHSRMPVIMSENSVSLWLSRAKFEDLKDLLRPYRSPNLKWYPVDKKVGSMRFQGEECAKKINVKYGGDIKPFFEMKHGKHEPRTSFSVTPAAQVKTEKKTLDDTPTKHLEKHDARKDAAPVRHHSTTFVPASSLLHDRIDDDKQDSPSKRRRMSSPINVKPSAKIPKQSSLDFFFGKGS